MLTFYRNALQNALETDRHVLVGKVLICAALCPSVTHEEHLQLQAITRRRYALP